MSLTLVSPPRIGKDLFRQILTRSKSPAAPEADAMYDLVAAQKIDPCIFLAFFWHENQFGTTGITPDFDLKNPGSVRSPFDSTTALASVNTPSGWFAKYATWTAGAGDWANRMRSRYANAGLTTVELAIPKYAPSTDGNNEAAYIAAVHKLVAQWIAEDQQPMPAITTDFRKDTKWPAGHGYGRNVGTDDKPIWVAERTGTVGSVIVHTTNGNKGSSFRAECEFIRDSALVGIQDEISHDGTLAVVLPANKVAWHGGATLPGFGNNQSYGIELHNAIGEDLTDPQLDTLTWRVKQLIAEYSIPKQMIDTHRAVAVPHGRKTDPSDWLDDDFYAWRDRLYGAAPVPHPKMIYLRTTVAANLRQAPKIDPANVVRVLPVGDVAGYDTMPTPGQAVGGDVEWFHRADQLGFVHSSLLEAA